MDPIKQIDTSALSSPGEVRTLSKLPNMMNMILIVAVIVAALISMGELTITLAGAINVSLLVALLYLISSLVYKNNYSAGINKAKETEEYAAARKAFDEAVERIYERGVLDRIPEFCLRYREEDLKSFRSAMLSDVAISYDEYEREYLGKSKGDIKALTEISKEAKVVIIRANAAKGMNISRNVLMTCGETKTLSERLWTLATGHRSIGMDSGTRSRIDFGVNVISRALTTILAGAVGITIVLDDFSIRSIAQWAIRMLPVIWSAIVSYTAGMRNVLETLIPQLERKTEILKIFAAWSSESPTPKE